MSQVLYDAYPSLIRTKPFGTILAILMVVCGLALAALLGQAPLAMLGGLPGGIIGLVMFGLGFLLLVSWFIATKADHLIIKEDEIVWTHGLLSKQYTEINMASVRTVRIDQSLFQRIMGAGDLTIFTAGDDPEVLVRGLPEPHRIRDLIKGQSGAGV
ncbi:putative membrane protein [Thioflavicoccus mobilis 8321]|uniref:Putative membrane protein n=1 Tax=Thioflavicoccus mobilis 8321 TaxID=765912 RepID=L0GY51_9GAMM|nr:PH domain-containing protein [Thioflavicoccus mobilis]AGA90891.1 putative membrane protein [Thioflavicoccus mobilis 8321]